VIDLSPAHHSGRATRSSFECAIRIAATLSNHLHESGSSVRLVCVGLSQGQPLCADNRAGIAAIFDFLAELPTLDFAREKALQDAENAAEQSSEDAIRLPTYSGRKYLIGTDSTNAVNVGDRDAFQSIMIQLREFALELEDGAEAIPAAALASSLSGGELESGITIVDPETAASQFVNGWNGSYGHVA